MSGEFGAVVGRRGRAEIERLASLYGTSGMGRSEFCRSHGMALSTLNRHLKKEQNRQNQAGSNGVEQRRLVAVEVASAVTTVSAGEDPGALTASVRRFQSSPAPRTNADSQILNSPPVSMCWAYPNLHHATGV